MTIPGLYRLSITEQTESSAKASIELNADHDVFKGHFPESPVLPGVVMMDMVKDLLQQLTGKMLRVKRADQMKFLRLINPRENPAIVMELQYKTSESGYEVSAGILAGEHNCFKFKGAFAII